jgi:hypothetical protein
MGAGAGGWKAPWPGEEGNGGNGKNGNPTRDVFGPRAVNNVSASCGAFSTWEVQCPHCLFVSASLYDRGPSKNLELDGKTVHFDAEKRYGLGEYFRVPPKLPIACIFNGCWAVKGEVFEPRTRAPVRSFALTNKP